MVGEDWRDGRYQSDPDWSELARIANADQYARWCWSEYNKLEIVYLRYSKPEATRIHTVTPMDIAMVVRSQQKLLLRSSSLAQFCAHMSENGDEVLPAEDEVLPAEAPGQYPYSILFCFICGLVLLVTFGILACAGIGILLLLWFSLLL